MSPCWGTVALLALLSGCYEPPTSCRIRCDETTGCPGDLACVEGYCRPDDVTACEEPPIEWAVQSTGGQHACGLSIYQDLLCWGSNTRGQLGLGASLDEAYLPTRIDDQKWRVVSAGALHTCAIRADDTVWCWGDNADGQVKGEKGSQLAKPTKVTFDPSRPRPTFQQLSAGARHTCAIGDGQLWCWGHAEQVGIDATFATRIDMQDTWSAVSAGHDHTCAIAAGRLSCWGHNDRGQVNESPDASITPTLVDVGGLAVLSVSAGDQATCAIASATPGATVGELWCWGKNDRALLDSTRVDSGVPRRLGTVDTWSSVEVGLGIACATSSGIVSCWGKSYSGGLGNGLWTDERTFDKAQAIGSADEVSLSVRANTTSFEITELGCMRLGKTLSCWGANPHGELGLGMTSQRNRPVVVAPPEGMWTGVVAGDAHVCASTSTNALYCWGGDYASQISAGIARGATNPCIAGEPCNYARPTKAPPDITRFDDIVAGSSYTCMRDGMTVKCWGQSVDGALGAALERGFANVIAPAGAQWTKLWGGTRGNCGLTTLGSVACWGYFDGTTAPRPKVQMSTEIHDISDAKFGDDTLCMVRTDNARVCWGRNESYQIGDGTNTYVPLPTAFDPQTIASLSLHGGHACAVTLAGGVLCWGTNFRGESNAPANGTGVMIPTVVEDGSGPIASCTKVAVGREHSCAICAGRVLCWGDDTYGATGVPDTSTSEHIPAPIAVTNEVFVDLAARAYGTCALTEDGKLYCWGEGTHGTNGDGGQSRNIPTDLATKL